MSFTKHKQKMRLLLILLTLMMPLLAQSKTDEKKLLERIDYMIDILIMLVVINHVVDTLQELFLVGFALSEQWHHKRKKY